MPKETYQIYLDKKFPKYLDEIVKILNKYEPKNSSHTYSVIEMGGERVIWDSADGSCGPLELGQALEYSVDNIETEKRRLKAEIGCMGLYLEYLSEIGDAIVESKKFGGYPTYQDYLQSDHWQEIRKSTILAADNRCMLCNSDGTLHVHHRTYENLGREEPTDIIALCDKCHAKFHNIKDSDK